MPLIRALPTLPAARVSIQDEGALSKLSPVKQLSPLPDLPVDARTARAPAAWVSRGGPPSVKPAPSLAAPVDARHVRMRRPTLQTGQIHTTLVVAAGLHPPAGRRVEVRSLLLGAAPRPRRTQSCHVNRSISSAVGHHLYHSAERGKGGGGGRRRRLLSKLTGGSERKAEGEVRRLSEHPVLPTAIPSRPRLCKSEGWNRAE